MAPNKKVEAQNVAATTTAITTTTKKATTTTGSGSVSTPTQKLEGIGFGNT